MSAIAAPAHAAHDHHASVDHASVEAPANGSFLPHPRCPPTYAALAFLFACGSAPVAAYFLSLSLLYMNAYSVTIGAWMGISVIGLWAPLAVGSILLAHDRGEWG